MTMDTFIEKVMNMILRKGKVFKFKECGSGLYYYGMASTDVQDGAKNNTKFKPYSMLSTVTENGSFIHSLMLKERTEQEDIKEFQVGQQLVISSLVLTTISCSIAT